jgi:hypothetical protein
MSSADASWWFSRLVVGWAIYVAVAWLIAAIGTKVWGNDPKTKAKLEEWRKSSDRRFALRVKAVGLGASILGLPLGVAVDTLAKVGRRGKSETKPSHENDEPKKDGPSRDVT